MADNGMVGVVETPTKSAKVDEWRAYAVAQGMSEDDAKAATKAQLVERYGAPATSESGPTTIYAPNPAFNGTVAGVRFEKGRAKADPAEHRAAFAYFRRRGYGIGERAEASTEEPQRVDARDAASVTVGTPLRDAAVEPRKGDFLAPVNAGEADPHGPRVVAPQVHGSGPRGVKPGDVHVAEPAKQDRAESAHAEAALVEGQPHPAQR